MTNAAQCRNCFAYQANAMGNGEASCVAIHDAAFTQMDGNCPFHKTREEKKASDTYVKQRLAGLFQTKGFVRTYGH